jgi:hypothetical protein
MGGNKDLTFPNYYALLDSYGYDPLDRLSVALHGSAPRRSTSGSLPTDDNYIKGKILTLLSSNLHLGQTRVSPKFLKFLLGNRIIDKYDLCARSSAFASSLIECMSAVEATLPEVASIIRADRRTAHEIYSSVSLNSTSSPFSSIKPEVDSLEFLLDILDDCGSHSIDIDGVSNAIISAKVSIPLVDILRVPIVADKKRGPTLLTNVVKANNPIALVSIARRAMSEGITLKAQKRIVEIAVQNSHLECIAVLCREFFVVAPLIAMKFMIESREKLENHPAERGHLFKAILSNINVCVARGILSEMIDILDKNLNIKIFDFSAETNTMSRSKVCDWEKTLLTEFLSTLWDVTSGDEQMRSAVVNTPPFRNAVSRALVANTLVWHDNTTYDAGGQNDEKLTATLSNTAKLLDIQRHADWAIDLSDGVADFSNHLDAESGKVYHTSLNGIVLDRWLRNTFIMASFRGFTYIDYAVQFSPEIRGFVDADIVHTDDAFAKAVAMNPAAVGFKWFSDVLFRACAERRRDGELVAERSTMARRLLRWCLRGREIIASSNEPQVADIRGLSFILSNLTSMIIGSGRVESLDLPSFNQLQAGFPKSSINRWCTDPRQDFHFFEVLLKKVALSLSKFVTDICKADLNGVEILYTMFGGNLEAALRALTAPHAHKHTLPEPEGHVRDIVIYVLASMSISRGLDTFKIVTQLVGAYTEGVTLPCVGNVIGALGGLKSTRIMARWLRDLIRGREPHTVWWSNLPHPSS